MIFELKALRQNRKNVLSLVEKFTNEQLNAIPAGFKNNLMWNAGHLVVTQQLLSYGLSRKDLVIEKELVPLFRKGSEARIYSDEEIEQVKSLLTQPLDQFEADLKTDKFDSFQPYFIETFGIQLENITEAVKFNHFHEGLHYGYMLALKNSLK